MDCASEAMSADEAIAAGTSGAGSALNEAKEFLLDVLHEGPQRQKDIWKQADEAGIRWSTLRRAKDALGIESAREGGIGADGQWNWCLPEQPKVSGLELGRLSDVGPLSDTKMTKLPKVSNAEAGRLSSNRPEGAESPNGSNP